MATSEMNIHYLTSSHTNPHFYIFTQLFEAEHTDGDALDLSCNWKGIKESSWQDFWQREGPQLLEEKWNKRFPEYKAIEADEAEKLHWLQLWEEHVKDQVNRLWHLFSCAFENYQHELLKSFAPITTEDLDEVDEELEQLDLSETQPESTHNQKKDIFAEDEPYLSGNDDPEYMEEKKQSELQSSIYDETEDIEEAKLRELLGLPVSFGPQPKRRQPRVEQNSSNYDNAEDFEEEEEEEVERKPMGLSASNNSKSREPATKEWFEQDFYSLANWDMTSDEEPETEAEALHAVLNGFIKKKKPKKKKKKTSDLVDQMPDFIKENKGKLFKYWRKRFSLFSRFDQGIRLDRESWFSVTPEKIAKQTARRLACDVILDAFCGCGGNAIQFAFTCARVIAVDIDAEKLAMAKHNARIYGVADKIEFIHADFLQLAASTKLRPDVVFFSPPWGGPNYINQATFDIERSLLPVSASLLMGLGRRLADNVGFFLPRNTSISQVIALSGAGQQCEVEHNFLDTRLVALTAYFGNGLIKNK
ncbi:blast:Trimethylguanosine synthase [Drosophila guanche]|uniref:Trimethylguanosine synthase n=1 Tax=Drosophila guanche TaxID=7266 RepID=A0A3B0KJC0_DROGU|nr:blast:Trimethylguanosine synthase [Drosophila guanche]